MCVPALTPTPYADGHRNSDSVCRTFTGREGRAAQFGVQQEDPVSVLIDLTVVKWGGVGGDFPLLPLLLTPGSFGDFWRHLGLSQLWEGMLLVSGG